MKNLTMVQLLLAANALIRVLELKAPNEQGEKVPVVIAEDATEAEVTAIITEAVGYIEERDHPHFTNEEKVIIHEFAPDLYGDVIAKAEAKAKPAKAVKEEKVEEVEAPEEKETTLEDEINDAQRLSTLKDIAQSNDEFKAIRGKLSSFKTAAVLKEALLKVLAGEKEVEQATAEKLHEENIEKKGVNEVKEEKKEPAEVKAEKPVKEKKPRAEKPEGSKTRAGIFAEIFNEGKPLTMAEWSEEMNSRYSSDSLAGAKTFTSLYMQILVELGFVVKKDGKFVKAGKK